MNNDSKEFKRNLEATQILFNLKAVEVSIKKEAKKYNPVRHLWMMGALEVEREERDRTDDAHRIFIAPQAP